MTEQNYRIAGGGAKEIAASLEAAIGARALAPGDRLPTVRGLAVELDVSTATVADAYRRLRDRGLVTGAGRGGTRVRAARPRSFRRSAPTVGQGVRNLAGGNPDPALLPDLGPALERAAAPVAGQRGRARRDGEPERPSAPVAGQRRRSRLYGEAESSAELVARFAGGFAVDGISDEHVVIVGGALDGVARALGAHLRPGDRVAVEDPCYCGILDVLEACDLSPVPVAIDERGARPEALEPVLDHVDAVLLMPRLHSPTGAAHDAPRLDDLRAVLARRPELLVVEDDHGALIADVPLHALAQNTDRPHWAIVRSTSKPLGPDLRLGALAADPLTAARVLHTQQAAVGWVSHLLQQTALALFEDPGLDALLAQARDTYTSRRRALVDALAGHGVAAHGASGLNVWLPVDDETTTAQTLLARGWALRSGAAFRLDSRPGLRITTAALTSEEAAVLAQDIADALSDVRANRAA